MSAKDDAIRREREDAWLGDAVLGLFAREFILARFGGMDAEIFAALTSNQFLSTIGRPTAVEAEIGRLYRDQGLPGAFAWLEAQLLPRYSVVLKKRTKSRT